MYYHTNVKNCYVFYKGHNRKQTTQRVAYAFKRFNSRYHMR